MEQDQLNERLSGAEHAPVHLPAGTRVEGACYTVSLIHGPYLTSVETPVAVEDDEEAQLRELQAALAM